MTPRRSSRTWVRTHTYRPGDVVGAAVPTTGYPHPKVRPVILVRRDGDQWGIVSLSTKAYHPSWEPRAEVPNGHVNGLAGTSYLRDSKLRWIPDTAIAGKPMGVVDLALVRVLDDNVNDITDDDLCNLLMVARP